MAEANVVPTDAESWGDLVGLIALAWLQGVNYGTHATLHEAEEAFLRLQTDLS